MAKEWVHDMKPYGQHWTLEETTSAAGQYGISLDKYCKYTWYAILNMMYNDYCTLFSSDTSTYIKLSKAWLDDMDAPQGDIKAYRYYRMLEDE